MASDDHDQTTLPIVSAPTGPRARITDVILTLVGTVPDTTRREETHPGRVARAIARRAAAKAAVTAGSLAVPPGPLGWLTIVPELVAVWKIQARMVSDLAGVYGRTATLTREHLLYCLFRHTAAQALRDLVVRVGQRLLVRRVSLEVIQRMTRTLGIRVAQRSIGSAVTRWVPIAGAVGVGAYAFYDTGQVAATAIALFEQDFSDEVAA